MSGVDRIELAARLWIVGSIVVAFAFAVVGAATVGWRLGWMIVRAVG